MQNFARFISLQMRNRPDAGQLIDFQAGLNKILPLGRGAC
jgi:hypothetical protein